MSSPTDGHDFNVVVLMSSPTDGHDFNVVVFRYGGPGDDGGAVTHIPALSLRTPTPAKRAQENDRIGD
jgi:hypothetical protein